MGQAADCSTSEVLDYGDVSEAGHGGCGLGTVYCFQVHLAASEEILSHTTPLFLYLPLILLSEKLSLVLFQLIKHAGGLYCPE